MDAKEFAHAIRAHWLIEHSLHWVLDVKMNEDASPGKDHQKYTFCTK